MPSYLSPAKPDPRLLLLHPRSNLKHPQHLFKHQHLPLLPQTMNAPPAPHNRRRCHPIIVPSLTHTPNRPFCSSPPSSPSVPLSFKPNLPHMHRIRWRASSHPRMVVAAPVARGSSRTRAKTSRWHHQHIINSNAIVVDLPINLSTDVDVQRGHSYYHHRYHRPPPLSPSRPSNASNLLPL